MDKITIFLILAIIISITILGVAGEYYVYQYSSFSSQQAPQQPQTSADATPTVAASQQIPGSSENSIISFDLKILWRWEK